MSWKTDLPAETKGECVNKSMPNHLLHCALAFCRYCAVKSWLFLLLCTWDFIICYNVQDKDSLWRCKEHNKAVEPMGIYCQRQTHYNSKAQEKVYNLLTLFIKLLPSHFEKICHTTILSSTK